MTKIIKEVTLKEIKRIQDSGDKEINLTHLTMKLQSNIIINISVGTIYASTELDYETANGMKRLDLAGFLD